MVPFRRIIQAQPFLSLSLNSLLHYRVVVSLIIYAISLMIVPQGISYDTGFSLFEWGLSGLWSATFSIGLMT
jgi:hypothetical protein